MARQTSATAEEVRKRARARRGPKTLPKKKPSVKPKTLPKLKGKKGVVESIKKPVLNLRSNKNSKLYKMQPSEFRSWFKAKYRVAYPYNVPKQSAARKK